MNRVPWWWPSFRCRHHRCRDASCLINDACWFVMSLLFVTLIFAYSATNTAEATDWFVMVPPK